MCSEITNEGEGGTKRGRVLQTRFVALLFLCRWWEVDNRVLVVVFEVVVVMVMIGGPAWRLSTLSLSCIIITDT